MAADAPSIISPYNGQDLDTQFPVFTWSHVSGATGYGIELLTQEPENPNGTGPSQYRIAVGATSGTTWNGDIQGLSAGTYYYRVIAWNQDGFIAGFSDTDSFTITEVNITSPLNGQTLSTQFPVFQWDHVSGATGYGIELLDQLPENPNSTTASQYRIAVGATSGITWNGDIRGLSAGTYYYRVIAWNQDGFITGFSDADSFVAPKVTLNSLSWTDATSPYFSWQAMSGATGYGIELLDQPPENPNSTTASQYRMAVGATSDTFWDGSTISLLGGTYYYRVIAWNDNGFIGGFSDAASFEVIRPNLNTITWSDHNHPYFSWTDVTGADEYEIELLKEGTYPIAPNGVTEDPNRLAWARTTNAFWYGDTTDMEPGVYYYRVIARSAGSVLGTYSNAGWFRVEEVIGYSVQGRPIYASKIGSGAKKVIFVAGHHGDEQRSMILLEKFRDYLCANLEAVPAGSEVWIIPCLNPDGRANNTRWNFRGVNLNRNYATNDWGTVGTTGVIYDVLSQFNQDRFDFIAGLQVVVQGTPYTWAYPGPYPMSEPETQALKNLCDQNSFNTLISYHEWETCIYTGQIGWDVAYLMSYHNGLPFSGQIGISGDTTRWFNQAYGRSAVTVELAGYREFASDEEIFSVHKSSMLAVLE